MVREMYFSCSHSFTLYKVHNKATSLNYLINLCCSQSRIPTLNVNVLGSLVVLYIAGHVLFLRRFTCHIVLLSLLKFFSTFPFATPQPTARLLSFWLIFSLLHRDLCVSYSLTLIVSLQFKCSSNKICQHE